MNSKDGIPLLPEEIAELSVAQVVNLTSDKPKDPKIIDLMEALKSSIAKWEQFKEKNP